MKKQIRLRVIIIVMLASMIIAGFWTSPWIKDPIHFILDPTVGSLLKFNLEIGMIIIVLLITVAITLLQKYTTDQTEMKRLKVEQKKIQDEMKTHKDNPAKMMELQKKSFEYMPLMMKHSMQPMIFTAIPIVLFFRWFSDYFTAAGNPVLFGFFSWFWFYFLVSIILSIFIRKLFKVE